MPKAIFNAKQSSAFENVHPKYPVRYKNCIIYSYTRYWDLY